MSRFYRLDVQPNLFGQWCLMREWGRIGRDAACCGDVRAGAIEKKLQLENKIRTLKATSKALDGLNANCDEETHPVEECPILAALEQAEISPQAAGRS